MTSIDYVLNKEVNILEDKKIALKLNIYGLICLILFLPIFWFISKIIIPFQETTALDKLGILDILLPLIFFFLLIIIHEGIHACFMKLFDKKGNIRFGFKNGMAYAASPGSRYSRRQFFWISLAPFILLTLTMTLLLYLGIIDKIFFILMTSMHASGCTGDFYWGLLVIKAPKEALIEDTDVGIKIYQKQKNVL